MAGTEQLAQVIDWTGDGLELRIEVGQRRHGQADPAVGARRWEPSSDAGLPLLDVVVAGEGRSWSGGRYCESEAAYRFGYVGHDASRRRRGLAGAAR